MATATVPNVGAQMPASPTASPSKQARPSPLRSIIAGSAAGAVEIAITFPLDFAKTRIQLNSSLHDGKKMVWPPFGKSYYVGCTAAMAGNALKCSVRFLAFDMYRNAFSSADGTVSGPATVAAGALAGITESLVAVCPTESIKTQLIDDRKRAQPRMRGFLHGSALIAREQGIRGFFRGLPITALRQGMNSAVRFGSFTSFKQAAQSYVAPGEKLGTLATFAIGGAAGVVTVYATQPIDTVKTRMQSMNSKALYKNSFDCVMKIFREEGLFKFYSGAVPRLGRLILSGGIVFTAFEEAQSFFEKVDPEGKYI